MLTLAKIEIYKRYDGDIDRWARSGRKKDKLGMQDDDWHLITGFIGDFTLIKNGLAAESYVNSFNNRLLENCDEKDTIDQIKKLVGQDADADKENEVHSGSALKNLLRLFKKSK